MTIHESIKWIDHIKDYYIHGGDEKYDAKRKESLNMAIQALEKQIPKTVNYTANGYADGSLVYDMAECPNCGIHYEESDQYWEAAYCLNCGQALEWEEKRIRNEEPEEDCIYCKYCDLPISADPCKKCALTYLNYFERKETTE